MARSGEASAWQEVRRERQLREEAENKAASQRADNATEQRTLKREMKVEVEGLRMRFSALQVEVEAEKQVSLIRRKPPEGCMLRSSPSIFLLQPALAGGTAITQ